jgi:hypothetical protein
MQGIRFLVWSIASPLITWYVVRRQYRGLLTRTLAASGRALEDAGKAAQVDLNETRGALDEALRRQERNRELLEETRKRAEIAEGIVRGQAKHIEALQASNDTMLAAITDMRRTGFSLPADILNAPDPETITTVHDDDLQALKDHPHLAAGDDD